MHYGFSGIFTYTTITTHNYTLFNGTHYSHRIRVLHKIITNYSSTVYYVHGDRTCKAFDVYIFMYRYLMIFFIPNLYYIFLSKDILY